MLWDLALFFEVHEILEPAWMETAGDRKRLLQALIRAAGVYINLELGYCQRAEKIASKALPVLEELGDSLTSVMDIDTLIEALQTLPDKAPQLSETEQKNAGSIVPDQDDERRSKGLELIKCGYFSSCITFFLMAAGSHP